MDQREHLGKFFNFDATDRIHLEKSMTRLKNRRRFLSRRVGLGDDHGQAADSELYRS